MSHHHKSHHSSGKHYTFYSQKNPKWASKQFGFGDSISAEGCALTCLSMLYGKDPVTVNQILMRHGAFLKNDFVKWPIACVALKLGNQSHNSVTPPAHSPIIGRLSLSGGGDHFVLRVVKDGKPWIIDPLDSTEHHRPVSQYSINMYYYFS